jgi:iron complex transport system ATP-binding protein
LSGSGIAWRVGERQILGPLDLEVAAGECVAVVGPNGAGKTTLLRLLGGVLQPSEGIVSCQGRPLSDYSRRELARRIAYVPQIRPARIPLTVEEVVLLGRYPHRSRLQLAATRQDFTAAREALARVGITELKGRPVDELSGGERQAVFIASALAQEAEVLILDEPTLHLDALHQRELAGLLVRLQSEGHLTVLLATHDLNLASLLGDRLLALEGGRPLALGTPAEVLDPALLAQLFRAPFEIIRGGDRPVAMLQLQP